MSYHDLPDPRPLSVKFALGRMPRAMAMTLMVGLIGLTIVCLIGLCIDHDRTNASAASVVWTLVGLMAGLLSAQYFMAIRWADFHKAWPRRRSYRKHRATR
jgi:hypothetical protein